MNCKHCGSKLGILERWRYGDFCSEGHKADFADDLVHLNEAIVKDLRRAPNWRKSQPQEPVDTVAPLEAAGEGVPPEADFVLAPDSPPVRLLAEPAEPELPSAPRGKSDQWRLFAKVAEWAELPTSVLAASRKKQLRFVWVTYATNSLATERGALLSGEYPAFLPHPELRQWQAQLQMAIQSEPSAIVAPVTPQAHDQNYWVDDEGWRWIPDGAAISVPDFGPVLSEFPIAAPWQNWAEGAGFSPRPSPAKPSQPVQAETAPQTKDPPPGQPAPPMGFPPGPAGSPPPGIPAQPGWQGSPTTQASVAPGIPTPAAWPVAAAPPFASVHGAPPQAAWPGGPAWAGGMVGYAPHHSALPPVPPWSVGLVWQELPPPLFNALVDPSHSLRPMPGVITQLQPPTGSITEPTATPLHPAGPRTRLAAMVLVDVQVDPLKSVAPAGGQPGRCDWQPRTLWRRMLAFPTHAARRRQPGIPRHGVPPLRLQSRPLPPSLTAAPVLYSGRWID